MTHLATIFFCLFQCILSKLGNLLLFHVNTVLMDIYVFEGQGTRRTKYHRIILNGRGVGGLQLSLISDNITSEG